jgi:hypothetical protein
MRTFTQLQQKFASVWSLLDERTRRLLAASEARTLGYGGISQVRRACGLSRKAIAKKARRIGLVNGRDAAGMLLKLPFLVYSLVRSRAEKRKRRRHTAGTPQPARDERSKVTV